MPSPAVVSLADQTFARDLATRGSLPRVVLDTNVWLDLLVFDDPAAQPIRAALIDKRLVALMAPRCRDELAIVLTYPQFTARALDVAAALAWSDAHTTRIPPLPEDASPAPLPQCRDRDDQKFLEAARDGHADWLISKDKAVLKLRSRIARDFGFRILTARMFAHLLATAPNAPAI